MGPTSITPAASATGINHSEQEKNHAERLNTWNLVDSQNILKQMVKSILHLSRHLFASPLWRVITTYGENRHTNTSIVNRKKKE
jgi:hypothetical protein